MTSRERIFETLAHREPEELAIDFGGMRSTGIHAVAYRRLVEHLGLKLPPPRLYDVYQQLAEPQPEVVARLGGDVYQAHQRCPAFGIPIDEGWREFRMQDGTKVMAPDGYRPVPEENGTSYLYVDGVRFAAKPASSLYFDQIVHPYEHCETEADIDAVPLEPWGERELAFIERECREIWENTDKAILVSIGGNIYEAGEGDFGFENFLVYLLTEPDLMHYYFNRITDVYMTNLRNLLPRIEKYRPVLQFGDDLGTQEAPQISVQTYREMIKPYHARQFRFVRDNFPRAYVFLHSCGAIRPLIPDLIDAGVQILNPVQISARDMDPAALKREFGKDLTFWGGGANAQKTMLFGTPEQAAAEARELIGIFAPGGGFVFNQVHNIQPGIPPENILAVYDTALAYRAGKGK